MNILYEETIAIHHFKSSPLIVIIIIVLIGLLILLGLLLSADYVDMYAFICTVSIFLALLLIWKIGCNGNDTYEKHYYIAVNEQTLFKDVINKYDIIEQKGNLCIVKDKESE